MSTPRLGRTSCALAARPKEDVTVAKGPDFKKMVREFYDDWCDLHGPGLQELVEKDLAKRFADVYEQGVRDGGIEADLANNRGREPG